MVCPHCHSETSAALGVCTVCRAPLPADPDATMSAESPPAPSSSPDDGVTISSKAGASGSGAPMSGGFAPGTLFAGRYRIERMLGAGGMGAVYEAWDHELGVTIALKVI